MKKRKLTHITSGTMAWSVKQNPHAAHSTHCFVIAAAVFICYANSLNCGLVFDDVPAIVNNMDLRQGSSWTDLFHHDFWGTPIHKEESHKSYRPLCVFTFRFNFWLHELRPLGYHLINLVLHGIVCILYYRLCLHFLPTTPSFLAGLLFAVHPIHTETVTGAVGRAELLSSAFFLATLLIYITSSRIGTFLNFRVFLLFFGMLTFAMLSKEQGITVAAVCFLEDITLLLEKKLESQTSERASRGKVKGPTPTWRKDLVLRLLIVALSALVLLVLRMKIMGSKLPVFNKFDNPAASASTLSRRLTYHYLLSLNTWLLLFPWDLCCDWTMSTVPLLETIMDSRNIATCWIYLSSYILLRNCSGAHIVHSKRIIMGFGLLCIPFVPATNLFFPVGFVIAERVLYLPSMGFCFFVAYGWHLLYSNCSNRRWWKILMGSCLLLLLCLHAAKTIRRNMDWKDEESLFLSGLSVTTKNAKLWNNLGHVFTSKGQHHRALDYFTKATEVQPDDIGGYLNLGSALSQLGRTTEAEMAFWKAKSLLPKVAPGRQYKAHIAPRHLELFRLLGNLLSRNESRLEEAQQLYKEATNMKRDYTEAYLDRAGILIKLNRSWEAKEAYNQALKHDQLNPDIFYNIGVLLLEEGNSDQALQYFDKALQINPEHEKSLINYAILTQETGDAGLRRLAQERLKVLLNKGNLPPERIYFNMGMLAMEDKEWSIAETYFRRAIQSKANFTSALFNMALLLHNLKRPLEAVPYLQLLLEQNEYHLKGLMLLGNIYFTDVRNYYAAKECYEMILRQNQVYIPALHNLCAVHVQLNELEKAEECLTRAQGIAPNEEYITDHLHMVRQYKQQKQNVKPTGGLKKDPDSGEDALMCIAHECKKHFMKNEHDADRTKV